MENIELSGEFNSNQSVIYDVIEIDDESGEEIDKNFCEILVESEEEKNIDITCLKHIEVYSDSVNQNSLQYVCSICNFNIQFFEKILDHFQEKCDYLKNRHTPHCNEIKCGDIYIENRWKMIYKCVLCNKVLFDTMIFVHLSQHLDEFKKGIKFLTSKDKNITKRKIVDIYLANDCTTKRFWYCCTSCGDKFFTFLLIRNHLQEKKNTCGNPLLKVELKDDTQCKKFGKPVCEVYINMEKAVTYVCQYCFKIYLSMQSTTDHLAGHINKAILNQTSNSKDTSLKIVKTQSLVSTPIKKKLLVSASDYKCQICEKLFKLKASLQCHLQVKHSIKIDTNSLSRNEILGVVGKNSGENKVKKIRLILPEPDDSGINNGYYNNTCTEITKIRNESSLNENSLGKEDSNPRKLLDFCRRPLPNIFPKTFPDSQLPVDNNNIKYEEDDCVIVSHPDEDPNLYISEADIQHNSDIASSSKNDVNKFSINDDSTPAKLLQFCKDPNLLLKTSPAD